LIGLHDHRLRLADGLLQRFEARRRGVLRPVAREVARSHLRLCLRLLGTWSAKRGAGGQGVAVRTLDADAGRSGWWSGWPKRPRVFGRIRSINGKNLHVVDAQPKFIPSYIPMQMLIIQRPKGLKKLSALRNALSAAANGTPDQLRAIAAAAAAFFSATNVEYDDPMFNFWFVVARIAPWASPARDWRHSARARTQTPTSPRRSSGPPAASRSRSSTRRRASSSSRSSVLSNAAAVIPHGRRKQRASSRGRNKKPPSGG